MPPRALPGPLVLRLVPAVAPARPLAPLAGVIEGVADIGVSGELTYVRVDR